MDCLVVGGGFFGCWVAATLRRRHGLEVTVVEREPRILQRASYNNQARVHNGYHYPRSTLTGLRSRVNYERFLADFPDCVDTDFQMYYCVGRIQSNVNARQFERFCEHIGAWLEPADDEVAQLFRPDKIEAVYKARECAFDADGLAARLAPELDELDVELLLDTEVLTVRPTGDPDWRLAVATRSRGSGDEREVRARFVFNCTYSNINTLLTRSGLSAVPLKQELAEIALVQVPEELRHVGVTVMCGPFFSFMPFPARGLHSFSHVRYTPDHEWHDADAPGGLVDNQAYFDAAPRGTSFPRMRADARRFLPVVDDFEYCDSLWEVKTVLPRSEGDDSRPILFKTDAGAAGLVCVLGGKIDNVYDVDRELERLLGPGVGAAAGGAEGAR